MPRDVKFDPVSGDVIRDGKGGWVVTDTAETTVLHQLSLHLAKWWGRGDLGSMLYDHKRFGAQPEVSAPLEAERALKVLVTRGRIANVKVRAEVPRQGRVNIATQFRDTSTGSVVSTFVKPGR